ncbi:MAG: hypothetical protein QM765_09260 [Myxococcales bacterium]
MTQTFEVTLDRDATPEKLLLNGTNVVMAQVYDSRGRFLKPSEVGIAITLSRSAMLALGIHLIRAAHGMAKLEHSRPADSELITVSHGVFLHPESCDLILAQDDLGDIHDLVNQSK